MMEVSAALSREQLVGIFAWQEKEHHLLRGRKERRIQKKSLRYSDLEWDEAKPRHPTKSFPAFDGPGWQGQSPSNLSG